MLVSTLRPNDNPDIRFLPLIPNWSAAYRASHEFKTDVILTEDGVEQRRAGRNEPRKRIQYSAVSGGAAKRRVEKFFDTWHSKPVVMPEVTLQCDVTTPPPPGTSIAVLKGPLPAWVVAGADVVLVDGDVMETRRILAVNFTVLTFYEVSETQWTFRCKLHPARFGRVSAEFTSTHVTSNASTHTVDFEINPGSEKQIEYVPPVYVDYREIFLQKPNWYGGVEVKYVDPREDVDYEIGIIEHFISYAFRSKVFTADYMGADWLKVQYVVDFFNRQKGRRGEFLLPSWENDIDYDAIVGGTSQIIVRGLEFAEDYSNSTVYRRILFRMRDGTYIQRTINDIESLPETNVSVITLTEPIPTGRFDKSTIYGLSWVYAARFATDLLEVEWLTNTVAQFRLTFQTLENFEL